MGIKKSLLILFCIAGIFFLAKIFFISNFSLVSDCENNFLYEVASPNKLQKAIVLERNCGATTDFTTMVSVGHKDYVLDNFEGVIFLADDDHNGAPHGRGRSVRVELDWLSNDTLLIMHHPKARVFQSLPERNGITILYKNDLE